MTTLSPELQKAVLDSDGQPVDVLDPQTQQHYVLLPAETYERLQLFLEQKALSQEEQCRLIVLAGKRAGWDDPQMDVYNDLDPRQ
jgi:PHD/YefM family antitoxin component YafN of YafNO toxin-antitoxin module